MGILWKSFPNHQNPLEILPKSRKSSGNLQDSRSEAAQIPEARLASRHTRMLGNAENDEVPGFFRHATPPPLQFWHLRCWTRVSNAHRTSAPWGPCEHSTILSCTITTISLLLYSAVLHCPAHLLYLPCPSPPHIQHPFCPPSTNHTKPLPNQPPSSIVSINQKGGESEGRGTKSICVLQ